MTIPTYIPKEQLIAAAEAIAALEPCPFAGAITRDQVLMAMGEHGDIWLASLLPHCVDEYRGLK
jgi:hypothetical protein